MISLEKRDFAPADPAEKKGTLMAIKESGEMYLETILLLSQDKDGVHAIDIAEKMAFSRPSVSRALSNLKAEGLVDVDGSDHVHLTESGRAAAEKIYERHTVLAAFLESLGVSKENAEIDACRMEHVISGETFEAVKKSLGR